MSGSRRSADEALAASLASGLTILEAAKAAGVSEATAHRRLHEPDFAGRVQALRVAMIERAATRLADTADLAVLVLRSLLTSLSENIKLKAARTLLEMSLRLGENAELRQRLEALEMVLKMRDSKGKGR